MHVPEARDFSSGKEAPVEGERAERVALLKKVTPFPNVAKKAHTVQTQRATELNGACTPSLPMSVNAS